MIDDFLRLGQLLLIFFGVASIGWLIGGMVTEFKVKSGAENTNNRGQE